jgi:hypothetical protein
LPKKIYKIKINLTKGAKGAKRRSEEIRERRSEERREQSVKK